MKGRIDSYFGITERGSDFATEVRAGLVVFLAMSYVLVVNPNIMTDGTGMDWDAVFTATVLSAIIGTFVMAVYARYPVALAPGMGMNALFAYTIVGTMGYSWQQALMAVVISGVAFLLLTATGVREKILEAIPRDFRISIMAGIGMFIAFVGLQGSGIIVAHPGTLVTLGDFSQPAVMLALFGIAVTAFFFLRGWKAAIFIGIIITAVVGIAAGVVPTPSGAVSMPAAPDAGAFLKDFSIAGLDIRYFVAIFTLLMLDMFDTAGTLLAVGEKAGLMDAEGNLVDGNKALAADAIATVAGGALGTCSVTSYVESAAGIESGGRTGFSALVVCGLFALALFFSPLFSIIGPEITVAALLLVGVSMLSSLGGLNWKDPVVALTATVTVTSTVLAYSITDGIAFGSIFYALGMVSTGRGREVNPTLYVVAAVFLLYFALRTVYGV
ncbi:MAG: NCS2 family permease [Thermoplasmatales archaeon]|nr:NCS2 family permease [Thermoplasmatales archaeon]